MTSYQSLPSTSPSCQIESSDGCSSRDNKDNRSMRACDSYLESNIWIGDEVLFYRETSVGNWTGPFILENVNAKILTLNSGARNWLASVDLFILYRHHSLRINRSHNKSTSRMVTTISSGHWTLFLNRQELHQSIRFDPCRQVYFLWKYWRLIIRGQVNPALSRQKRNGSCMVFREENHGTM